MIRVFVLGVLMLVQGVFEAAIFGKALDENDKFISDLTGGKISVFRRPGINKVFVLSGVVVYGALHVMTTLLGIKNVTDSFPITALQMKSLIIGRLASSVLLTTVVEGFEVNFEIWTFTIMLVCTHVKQYWGNPRTIPLHRFANYYEKGLKPQVVDYECPICWCTTGDSPGLIWVKLKGCDHHFHRKCIKRWWKTQNRNRVPINCPCCRQPASNNSTLPCHHTPQRISPHELVVHIEDLPE